MLIYPPRIASLAEFVDFWSRRYDYSKEHLYDNNIGHELTEQRILELYEWKNGSPIAAQKVASVRRNYISRLGELALLPSDETARGFLQRFADGGAIWRIFWLHCWQPQRFPIYDQHVHRAMSFIQTGIVGEVSAKDTEKVSTYLESYIPFHATFEGFGHRSVDRALWAFGKFLNEANFPIVVGKP